MRIIQATKNELPIINHLAHKIWPIAYSGVISDIQIEYMLELIYSIKSLEEQLNNGHCFLLLKHQNEFIGFAAYQTNINDSNTTKLHKLYILPTTQSKGFGKFMLDYIKNKAIQTKNSSLYLNVNKYNTAKVFYEKQGFVVDKEEVIQIGNGYIMDDYCMKIDL